MLKGRGLAIPVTLHGPFAAPATCACSSSARGAAAEPAASDASLNVRRASVRLLDASCHWALDTSAAHLGPFGGWGISIGATLGMADGAGSAAVAMGGAAGRIRKSQRKYPPAVIPPTPSSVKIALLRRLLPCRGGAPSRSSV